RGGPHLRNAGRAPRSRRGTPPDPQGLVRRRRRVACAVVACALFTGAGDAAPADAPAASPAPTPSGINSVAALFALMASSPGLFARFHEEKQISLLVLPIK